MSKFIALTTLLNDGGDYTWPQLSHELKLPQHTIKKMIASLKSEGIPLIATATHCRLPQPIELLDATAIAAQLDASISITIFAELDSTQRYLCALSCSLQDQLCLAEKQTAGQGRLGRSWYSPFASNLYLSYGARLTTQQLSGLSLVVSLAVLNIMQRFGIRTGLTVKWPNDVLYQDKKLAGVLMTIRSTATCEVAIGIGINVNMLIDPQQQIAQPWTTMRQILSRSINRNDLTAALVNLLKQYINQFELLGFASFLAEWQVVDDLVNKHITVHSGGLHFSGTVLGVNQQGYLMLQLTNGQVQLLATGETSLTTINPP